MMIEADSSVGHRLLAPRIAYVIGTRGSGGPDLAPISNVTSVSRSPQVIVVAVFKEWQTYANLVAGKGFTLSVPTRGQNDAVWRLGEKYSGFTPAAGHTKLDECGTPIDLEASEYGPALSESIGWLECQITSTADIKGDHGVFFGGVVAAHFNEKYLTADGMYKQNSEPVMQVVGNTFASSTDHWTNEYFK